MEMNYHQPIHKEMDDDTDNCFLCFTKCDDWIGINDPKGIDLNIKEIVLKHFWLAIRFDELSKIICTVCWNRIDNFHEFYLQIIDTHKIKYENPTFIPLANNVTKDNDHWTMYDITPEINIKGEDAINVIEEVVFLDENDDVKDEQIDNDYNNRIDLNSEYSQHLKSPLSVAPIISKSRRRSVSPSLSDSSSSSSSGLIVKKSPVRSTSKSLQQKLKCKLSMKKRRKPLGKESRNVKKVKVKVEQSMCKKKKQPIILPDDIVQNERIRRYCQMQCEICGEVFEAFSAIRHHYREKHNTKGFIRCCGIKLYVMTRAMQHCDWHENPESFKCEQCSKCYMDKFKLKAHIEKSHTPSNERNFKCDLCTRTYTRLSGMLYHKRVSHAREEDKPFECDVCGLKFVVKAFLRFHIKRVHEDGDSRMCDICARYFKCAKSYDHHYLVHHSNIQLKVQCQVCQTWLKHESSLKHHLQRVHSVFESMACDMCDKTFLSKKSLYSHKYNKHQFREYPCSICNKPFKKKQTLKEHMAMHTGEKDLYKCLYCTRTFRSNANMYAHRKRNHPKEYEESILYGKKFD